MDTTMVLWTAGVGGVLLLVALVAIYKIVAGYRPLITTIPASNQGQISTEASGLAGTAFWAGLCLGVILGVGGLVLAHYMGLPLPEGQMKSKPGTSVADQTPAAPEVSMVVYDKPGRCLSYPSTLLPQGWEFGAKKHGTAGEAGPSTVKVPQGVTSMEVFFRKKGTTDISGVVTVDTSL